MILSNTDILAAMEKGDIVIDPFYRNRLQANSYDLSLGEWFVTLYTWYQNELEVRKPRYGNFLFVPTGQLVKIPGRVPTLVMTKEVVGARGTVTMKLEGRSSLGRMGISILTAGFGDNGYVDHWTVCLEGHVPADNKVCLQVGEPFVQAVFIRLESEPQAKYSGQYKDQEWPLAMLPKEFRSDYTTIRETDGTISKVLRKG